jgi:hypothetical protein
MIIGIDYWQVLSHYPDYFCRIIQQTMSRGDNEMHIISAIGKTRIGTIEPEVRKILIANGIGAYHPEIHEVVFDSPKQSPELKLAKCLELGIEVFYDDRDDVCRLLNKNGILALRVTRKDNSTYDLGAERH